MRLLKDKQANVNMILMAVVAAVTIAITLVVVFPIIGGLDTSNVDQDIQETLGESGTLYRNTTTPAANATTDLTDNLETFYSVAPIYIVVLAAVGIIAAIMMIVIKR